MVLSVFMMNSSHVKAETVEYMWNAKYDPYQLYEVYNTNDEYEQQLMFEVSYGISDRAALQFTINDTKPISSAVLKFLGGESCGTINPNAKFKIGLIEDDLSNITISSLQNLTELVPRDYYQHVKGANVEPGI